MTRRSSRRRCAALAGLLCASLSAFRCNGPDKDQRPSGPGGTIPPETPITNVENDARKEFKTFLNDPKLDVVPEEARLAAPLAKEALDRTFAELPPALKARIDASRPARCARNGCFKDVVYGDWATYYLVDQAVMSSTQPSAFTRYAGAQYRTGRSPLDRERFAVTWALMFPIRGTAK